MVEYKNTKGGNAKEKTVDSCDSKEQRKVCIRLFLNCHCQLLLPNDILFHPIKEHNILIYLFSHYSGLIFKCFKKSTHS